MKNSWNLSFRHPETGENMIISAQVPGNVIGDLFRAGLIPDPYYGTNSLKLVIWESVDWEYHTTFDAPEGALELHFDGVDTFASVFVNGTEIGRCDNMFIPHVFQLPERTLKPVGNQLTVRIESSVNYARQFRVPPFCRAQLYNYEGLYVRRPMHTYGWDIAPRLVGAGLWRGVRLEVVEPERWLELALFTKRIVSNIAYVDLSWNFSSHREVLSGYEAHLTLVCKDQELQFRFPLRFTSGVKWLEIADPHCWNPVGNGEPNLYSVTLELLHDGGLVDVRRWRMGIRTISLDAQDELLFVVNGRKTFIKGANWVPADALHGERRERIRKNLDLFRSAGCNMIRCWGGGVYEDEEFFDYCDENGLMVWQDFMFACEVAPLEDSFLEQVRREAETVVKLLRNHASLALWCGDNECDEGYVGGSSYPPSVNRITRETLPRTVMTFDPYRPYRASSPFISDEVWAKGDRCFAPEQHLWGARGNWQGRYYRDTTARFVSEIGYQGLPSPESLARFLPPGSLKDRTGADWLCHATQPYGDENGRYAFRIPLMENQFRLMWGREPSSLEEFSIGSRIIQAEAMKNFVESFRRKKWEKTGIIWWNMIDCWPQFSEAVVDYYYTPKPAWFYLKRAQEPFLLTVGDPEGWHAPLIAVNDTAEIKRGRCRVTDLETGELHVDKEFESYPDSAAVIASFPVIESRQHMLLIEWDGNFNHRLMGAAPFDLEYYLRWKALLDKKGEV